MLWLPLFLVVFYVFARLATPDAAPAPHPARSCVASPFGPSDLYICGGAAYQFRGGSLHYAGKLDTKRVLIPKGDR